MTARTCPVHGEYSETGACRWCEEPTAKAKAARMKTLREVFDLADWRLNLRAPISWRIEYADPARLAATNTAEESRLLAQHAALRWERVARRWAAKGPPPRKHRETVDGELAFDDHCASCVRLAREGRWP